MRNISSLRIISAVIFGVLILPATVSHIPSVLSSSTAVAATAEEHWERQWKKILNDAKKEKEVVMYGTPSSSIRMALSKAVKEKYGLEMQFVTGKGVALHKKVLSERGAGLYIPDVYMGGTSSVIAMLLPKEVMDPLRPELILPEVLDTKNWYGSKLPFIENKEYLFGFRGSVYHSYTINTKMVKPEEITSYSDLLKPKFKGKIAMGDPTAGGAASSFVTFVGEYAMGYDFIRELAKQEPFMSRDERLLVEWVARGKYQILIGTRPGPLTEFKKAGAPLLSIIAREGSFIEPGSGTIGLYNRRPRPNAARVFLNWLLTKEGQSVYAKAAGIESARVDVPNDHLPSNLVRQPGKKYIYANEQFHKLAEKNWELSKEVFGPLLK